MPLRILVLAPQPFFVQRGTPIAVRALLRSLTTQGHRCDALVYAEGEAPDLPGVGIFRVPALPGTRNMPPGFSLKKLLTDAVMLPVAAMRLRRGRYDLVIAVEEAAFIALALKPVFGVPYIYDVDSSIPEQMNDKFGLPEWLRRGLEAVEARAARGSIGAITCCRALEALVRGYAPGLPVQTLEDVSLIGEAASVPPDCRFDVPVVMYVGNLESYQGIELLMRGFALALQRGASAQLVIVGGTPAHVAAHEALARDLGIEERVSLLGPRPVERIGDYLGQADIVCSPRIQGHNTPMKVYSYLDSGRPLLATRLPTHTQVLDDDIAMLVQPAPEDMAQGLVRLLEDPALRDRLAGNAARRVAAEYSLDAYERKLSAFLSQRIEPRLPAT